MYGVAYGGDSGFDVQFYGEDDDRVEIVCWRILPHNIAHTIHVLRRLQTSVDVQGHLEEFLDSLGILDPYGYKVG